jgi:AbiU2
MPNVSGPPKDRQQCWSDWLETINQDITTVFYWKETWLAFGYILRSNPAIPPSHFFRLMSNTYGTSQAVAVRRLADPKRGVVSLATLIKDLRKHAAEVTVEWWIGLQPNSEIGDFEPFRLKSTNHFDPSIATKDLDRLEIAVAQVKKYVDQHLAHRDQNPTRDIPNFDAIHAALDSLGEVFRKYHSLLTGADRIVMVPVPTPGWFLPFTVPWLPPGAKAPEIGGTIRSLSR